MGWFSKKKKKQEEAAKILPAEQPQTGIPAPVRSQPLTEEQARTIAKALSQYLKDERGKS